MELMVVSMFMLVWMCCVLVCMIFWKLEVVCFLILVLLDRLVDICVLCRVVVRKDGKIFFFVLSVICVLVRECVLEIFLRVEWSFVEVIESLIDFVMKIV